MNKLKNLLTALFLTLLVIPTATAQTIVTMDNTLGTPVEFDETEGMTILYDSLLNDWKVKTYLYVDSTCHGTDIDPTFPDSVYIDRLQRIPAVMELPYNHIVRQYIDRYTKRLRKSVSVMLGAGNFYFPIFEAELERYNLPLELKYLPIIESALKPKAVSPAGAGGLWQFMVGTGKQYGLKVNSVIDERCDPIKSSQAAARYLRDLYRIYHDWALVLAAYNCGPGNVNKAIHRAGARDYWQIYPYLPKETRGYVPAFIAATYAMTYYCEHGICPMRSRFPINTDTIIVNRDISMRQISEVVGVDINLLKSLNPQYRTDRIPGKSQACIIRMPDEYIHAFLDYGDDIYHYRASELLARRAEVSVRGERGSRLTAQRTQQPSAPTQPTMPGSTMPDITTTEARVPTEPVAVIARDTIVATPRTPAGEVLEVALSDTTLSTSETNEEEGTTTITFTDDEEPQLTPVPTNTVRQRSATPAPATRQSSTPTTTPSREPQRTQRPAEAVQRNEQARQRQQQRTGQTTRQQNTQTQSQSTQTNRAQQPAQTQSTQRNRNQQPAQTQSTQRNRNQQPAQTQSTQRNRNQQPAQSQSTQRNRNQQPSQTQSTQRNRNQQPAQQQSTQRNRNQQPAQSQGTQRNRNGQSTQSQGTQRNRNQQPAQQQSTQRNRNGQSTQSQGSQRNRNQQPAQQQTRQRNSSQQPAQARQQQRQTQAQPQPQRPQNHTPRSGKARSGGK